MHNQTPSLITSFSEQKQGNREGKKKQKQAKVISKAELFDEILNYAMQFKQNSQTIYNQNVEGCWALQRNFK